MFSMPYCGGGEQGAPIGCFTAVFVLLLVLLIGLFFILVVGWILTDEGLM